MGEEDMFKDAKLIHECKNNNNKVLYCAKEKIILIGDGKRDSVLISKDDFKEVFLKII